MIISRSSTPALKGRDVRVGETTYGTPERPVREPRKETRTLDTQSEIEKPRKKEPISCTQDES